MAPKKETFKRMFGAKPSSRREQLRAARQKRFVNVVADVPSASDLSHDNNSSVTPECSQTVIESPEFVESAMKRKFRLLDDESDANENYGAAGKPTFLLFDVTILENIIEQLGCNKCMSFGSLRFETNTKYSGLAAEIVVRCVACNSTVITSATSKRCDTETKVKKRALEVNRRAAFAAIYTGYGFSGMEKFSMIMGMPIIHQKTFVNHSTCIGHAVDNAVTDILTRSADVVKKAYSDIGIFPDSSGILDISVSYDGSWMKRGHISNFGVGVAIDLLTGLVLDFEVLSRYCYACSVKQSKLTQTEFDEWYKEHVTCDKTFCGSAGAMEAEAATIIWKRSVAKHKLRYVELLSDGDSKTFQALTESNMYGNEHPLTKEECVNHVGKRMFTALSNAITESRAQGTTLGGKGKGKLTRNIQEKLALYYKKAIQNNTGDVGAMRDAVFATLFHSISTDSEPHHSRCPKGPDSWCFYNKALALGKTPGKHEKYVGTYLNKNIAEKLLPIYQRLGDESLLKRCLKGKTQNANESLHSVIWNKCPKIKFLQLNRVKMGVALAIMDFNYGRRGIQAVMKNLGIQAGEQTNASVASSDKKRICKSEECANAKAKHAKEVKRAARIRLEKRLEDEEGGPSYAAGAFL